MLQLRKDQFIGNGKGRLCYRHPEDSRKCVKVCIPGQNAEVEARRERVYFEKYRSRGCPMEHIATIHGLVNTNYGKGSVISLVVEPDGLIAKPLAYYIERGASISDFDAELSELRDYLLREGIICSDFNDGNVLLQHLQDGGRRLVIIDGLGNSDFVKLADYGKWFRDRKIERKWKGFYAKLKKYECGGRRNVQANGFRGANTK